jgi:cytochrome c oxidase accessory protein FixG
VSEPAAKAAPAAASLARSTGAVAKRPPRRSLPTLNSDGTRFVLHPRPSPGRFLRRRKIVGYALIALFVLLPQLRIGGRPPLLIDLVHREIDLLGAVFRPSEGVLLMLLGLAVALTVFLITAMFGRIWCGYGCPQTVYLELVFRPIERWIEGSPGRGRARAGAGPGWRRPLKWAIYAALAFAVANVFLSYFVPTDLLWHWITSSPAEHPGGFTVVLAVTALMFFDFAYFREQTCTVACPYGRLQSVLLDRRSLIVGYDAARGEPRGKVSKAAAKETAALHAAALHAAAKETVAKETAAAVGDCVDCNACVATCPTGIDIREGLQMECIGCAQCIDACDAIMTKLHRPPGLIRYATQEQLAGEPRRISRLRVWIYPVLLAVVLGALGTQLALRGDSELWLLRNDEGAFEQLADGRISSMVRLKIENRSASPRRYTVELDGDPAAQLLMARPHVEVAGGAAVEVSLFVLAPFPSFHGGKRPTALVVQEDGHLLGRLAVTLLGPEHATSVPEIRP